VITAIAEEIPESKYPIIKSYCTRVTQDFVEIWAGGNDTETSECIKNETAFQLIDIRPYAIDFRFNCSQDENVTIFTYNDLVEENSTKCT
jgi:hypothetical protein